MDALITRLREQTEELDTSDLAPVQHLPAVVRRGRRYMVAATAATVLGATAAVAGAAVGVPHVVQQFQDPQQPVVEPVGDDEPTPSAEAVEESGDEVEAPTVGVAPEPPVDEQDEAAAAPAAGSEEEVAPADVTPPDLVVTSPADGATVTSQKVTFTGEVEPGAAVKAGPYAADVAGDGSWSLLLIAGPGDNTVTFTATDAAGNMTTRTVTVTYTPPEKEATEESADDKTGGDAPKDTSDDPVASPAEFTANQQHAELTAEPHKNVYWGTANPGEKVKVISDYGWAYAYADDAGNWEVQVDFDPPAGTKQFTVTARYYNDGSVAETFTLTTVAPAAAEFTAAQQRSSVSASDPTNVYSGTGEPGHEVWIWTESHGQSWTTVAADGTWEIAVTYQEVAPGDTFPVKAKDTTSGTRHLFEVTITE